MSTDVCALGIDLGTGSVKAALLGATSEKLDVASAPVELSRPQPGWVESDPEIWWGAVIDTSICIGCKACEVACKEWNRNPRDGDLELLGSSYDNTGALGASTWRHVAFIEQGRDRIEEARESGRALIDLGMPAIPGPLNTDTRPPDTPEFRWLMSSDVCKHCTHAGCLDVCPTGALFRTEFGTVVVQDDVCNGCGTCVAGCPFGVIERRSDGTYATPERRRTGRPTSS